MSVLPLWKEPLKDKALITSILKGVVASRCASRGILHMGKNQSSEDSFSVQSMLMIRYSSRPEVSQVHAHAFSLPQQLAFFFFILHCVYQKGLYGMIFLIFLIHMSWGLRFKISPISPSLFHVQFSNQNYQERILTGKKHIEMENTTGYNTKKKSISQKKMKIFLYIFFVLSCWTLPISEVNV